MARSSKQDWLGGDGDLREQDVEDVPFEGQSVRVRALPAKYSAAVQSQMRLETAGKEQIARIDVAEMEILQFAHGVIDPSFSPQEARIVAEKYGPAFRKVIAVIDELSGVDKEAIEQAEQRFPVGGTGKNGGGSGAAPKPVGVADPVRPGG